MKLRILQIMMGINLIFLLFITSVLLALLPDFLYAILFIPHMGLWVVIAYIVFKFNNFLKERI